MSQGPQPARLMQRIPLSSEVAGMPGTLWRRGVSVPDSDSAAPLVLDAEQQVSFDTYFGSCFVGYWSRITDLGGVSATVAVGGSATLRMWHTGDGVATLVDEVSTSGSTSQEYSVGPYVVDNDRATDGRLWLEIVAHDAVSVASAGWFADRSPERDVALGVVVCTINRQEYLRKNLERLIATGGAFGSVERLVIVNQGEPLAMDDTIRSLRDQVEVDVISQPNLGGCGGFARGMFELGADDSISHVVLLDDDVVLNPDSLDRMRRLMGYARPTVCVGGHMLDLARPSVLYEGGGTLTSDGTGTVPINHDVDVSEPTGVDAVGRVRFADYNGWWMFGLGCDVVAEVGLPMPCFIRGDDIEYGVRLGERGYETVPMPGIALWHEPFYAKLANWQHYFDIRNRLTMTAIHGNGSIRALKRDLRKQFHRDSILSRYHSCEYLLMAVRDHLSGPDRCLDTTDEALRRCRRVFDELGPTPVDDRAAAPDASPRRLSAPVVAARRAARLVWPARAPNEVVDVSADALSPMLADVFDRYRVVEYDGSVWEFRRDPARERLQFVELERLLLRWRRPAFDSSVVEDADGSPWSAWWSRLFGRLEPAES